MASHKFVVIVSIMLISALVNTAIAQNCGCNYEGAGSTCSTGTTKGAVNLANYMKQKFGGRTESFNCRPIAGSSSLSLHAVGRAVDFFATASVMQKAWDHAISIACQKGIQEVIYNRKRWSKSGIKPYTGPNPHTDHVHISLNICGGRSFVN